MNGTRLFIDVSPLQELAYTGIPKVALELVKAGLARSDTYFFWDDYLIPRDLAEQLVQCESGVLFHVLASFKSIPLKPVLTEVAAAKKAVGIFPNVMTRFFFSHHVQVVHDLVFVTAPEYHNDDTINYHGTTVLRDALTADALICVSESTAYDVEKYLQVDQSKIHVALLGADAPASASKFEFGTIEKYILVVGTVEPRKNIELVLRLIGRNPQITDNYAFVFCGRDGWLISFDMLITKYGLQDLVTSGRIIRLPFVSEELKWELYRHASLLMFPSMYEGFGLPVLEALASHTQVLASCSSSICEAGGDIATYFDPSDYNDFEQAALKLMDADFEISRIENKKVSTHLLDRSWAGFANKVFDVSCNIK